MGVYYVSRLLLILLIVTFPAALSAQGGGMASALGVTIGKLETDAQKRGDAVFHKNCHLCHISTPQKRELNIAFTELVGLFKQPNITDQAVRQLIQAGIPGRMPSFRYGLNESQLNDLIAYLRIR